MGKWLRGVSGTMTVGRYHLPGQSIMDYNSEEQSSLGKEIDNMI